MKITKLDYYHATLKVVGDNIEEIASFADKVLNIYKNFDAEEIDLISRIDVLHSTITPICRKENNKFALYLIFRNNRTNEVEEGGIFHAHKIHHHIKSEGIGLIEAMGLFILPPRLISEMKNISDILQGKVSKEEFNNEKYSNMIDELLIKYGNKNSLEIALFTLIFFFMWLGFCIGTVIVGRNPQKFSKRIQKLFFKEECLRY